MSKLSFRMKMSQHLAFMKQHNLKNCIAACAWGYDNHPSYRSDVDEDRVVSPSVMIPLAPPDSDDVDDNLHSIYTFYSNYLGRACAGKKCSKEEPHFPFT